MAITASVADPLKFGMPEQHQGASPNARLLVGELPAPPQLEGKWWQGTGLSVAIHVLVLGAFIYAAMHARQVVDTVRKVPENINFIFLNQPGPGGGGGGGGTKTTEPPRKAEVLASKPKPVEVQPVPKPVNRPPAPELNIPVQSPQAVQMLPGALEKIDATSVGAGTGTGAGGGRGTGSGTGTGSGLGEGFGGGFGGGVYQIGNGVVSPQLIREVKPNYTAEAMRAKLQGIVEMEAVVLPDGSIDPNRIKITRSLDQTFGLDQQAILAVKQWRFRPGTFKGQPVAVLVNVELSFTLR
jgi:protein TonB